MTVESALAKLSFVMGKEALTQEEKKMVSFTSLWKTNASSRDFQRLHAISGVLCCAVLLGVSF